MRIGFQLFGGRNWTGGANYLENLLTALAELPGQPVQIVGFAEQDADPELTARVAPLLSEPPVHLASANRGGTASRLLRALALGRDPAASAAFRAARIDAFFQNMVFYGSNIGVPVLAWFPDFQHRHLPGMFSRTGWLRREIGFRALARTATLVVVSSETGRTECETLYGATRGRTRVLRFPARIPNVALTRSPDAVRRQHDLPEKFVYFPGQLWRHKNHLGVIEALRILKQEGVPVVVVSSGSMADPRSPEHGVLVRERVHALGLERSLRVLGYLPYGDTVALIRAAAAVLNPSFSEGWSTTVEEAKALGAPLVLSSLAVHREQACDTAVYFDPAAPSDLSRALRVAWERWPPGPRLQLENEALKSAVARRREFAEAFVCAASEAIERFAPKRMT